jgi:hypothetical protein
MAEPAPVTAPAKRPLKARLAALFAEYGTVALVLHFSISIATMIGFAIAIWSGAKPSSATGVLGVLGAAWALGKATFPIRILITLAITPPIAALWRRWHPVDPADHDDDDDDNDAAADRA